MVQGMKMESGEAVKALRTHMGLSQTKFGEAVGVAHTTVVYWEQGKSIGPFNRLRLLDTARRAEAPADVIETLEALQPSTTSGAPTSSAE
jgi:DNA-binding transcriptional regulator YiaG